MTKDVENMYTAKPGTQLTPRDRGTGLYVLLAGAVIVLAVMAGTWMASDRGATPGTVNNAPVERQVPAEATID